MNEKTNNNNNNNNNNTCTASQSWIDRCVAHEHLGMVEGSCLLRQSSFHVTDRSAILPRACMSNPLHHCVEVCIRQYTPRERTEKGKQTFTPPSPVLYNAMWHMTPHRDGFKTSLQLCMHTIYMCCGTCLQCEECSCIFALFVVSSAFDVGFQLCIQQNWLTEWRSTVLQKLPVT
jgi:hypothetical protein